MAESTSDEELDDVLEDDEDAGEETIRTTPRSNPSRTTPARDSVKRRYTELSDNDEDSAGTLESDESGDNADSDEDVNKERILSHLITLTSLRVLCVE